MRVLFCGSGAFAVSTLRAILACEHECVGIVTQPARPAGRGGKLRPTPVAGTAQGCGLHAHCWEDINSPAALEEIRRLRPDVICVVDYGQFLRAELCEAAPLGAFNLHGALLPQLRGAAPINWAIIRGFERTGVTTFSLVKRMDAGPIYLQRETEIRSDETADQLRDRLGELGAELVCRTLDRLASGDTSARQQEEWNVSYAPRLKKGDGRIDFWAEAPTVRNLIHGTWPWPGAKAVFERRKGALIPVTIARAEAVDCEGTAEPGTLDEDLLVATGAGKLKIHQIKPAGKRLMDWRDFVNGYRVTSSARFLQADQ